MEQVHVAPTKCSDVAKPLSGIKAKEYHRAPFIICQIKKGPHLFDLEGAFRHGGALAYCIDKLSWIVDDHAVSASALKQHLQRLEVMVGGSGRDLCRQLVPEGYNVLLGDFRDRLIRARPKEFDEFTKTLTVEDHRCRCGCAFLRLEPVFKTLAKDRPHDLFSGELLMQPIQDCLGLPQCPLDPRRLFELVSKPLCALLLRLLRRDPALHSVLIAETGREILRLRVPPDAGHM